MITIRQPVAVKFILTETTKREILEEQRNQVDRLSEELDQIEVQGKAAIEQAMAQGGDIASQVRMQVESEKQTRIEQREQLIEQIQQIQQLELGTEIQNMNVETSIDVRVGDNWGEILMGAEIVVKDGIVHEIRRNGVPDEE